MGSRVGQIPIPVEAPEPRKIVGYILIGGGVLLGGYLLWRYFVPSAEKVLKGLGLDEEEMQGWLDALKGVGKTTSKTARSIVRVATDLVELAGIGYDKISALLTDEEYRNFVFEKLEATTTAARNAAGSLLEGTVTTIEFGAARALQTVERELSEVAGGLQTIAEVAAVVGVREALENPITQMIIQQGIQSKKTLDRVLSFFGW